ncbi:MAG: DUF2110 family protein [Promethearchaeota archaeon]
MAQKSLAYVSAYQYYALTQAKTARERTQFLTTFQRVLEQRIPEDIEVKIKKIEFRIDDRISIHLTGNNADELKFVASIFKELTGETMNANNIPKRKPVVGQLTSVGKVGFGLFLDVGIEGPSKEVLIPLFRLRQQLVKGEKKSTPEIIELYGFIDHMPVEIEITKITYEKKGKPKIEGEFSERFLKFLHLRVHERYEVIFTTGVSRQMVKKTIAKRGHTVDIVQIDRIGPLETAVICKPGTTAAGIIAHIGQFIPHCRMSIFKPLKVQAYWKKFVHEK